MRTKTIAYDDPTLPTTDPNYHRGWHLRLAFTTVVDPGTGKLNLKSVTLRGTTGLPTETRSPGTGASPDAHRAKIYYYTGDTSSGDAACNSKPQWAKLPCKLTPAAQPGTAGLPNLPVTQYGYGLYYEQTSLSQTVGAATRTTTTTYDAAARVTDVAVTSTVGAALPAAHTDYDPATGRATVTSTTDAGGTTTITRVYDQLGRLKEYRDADGNTATTTYDLLDRPATVNDGKGTQTFTYDTSIDPRGLLTSLTDSAAGAFTARYDADGALVTAGYPNGLEARTTYNEDGDTTNLDYVKTTNCTTDCTWLHFDAEASIHGQILTAESDLSDQTYTYDATGRLASVEDTPAGGGCTIRSYGYNADSNRTSLTTKPPAADGGCQPGVPGTTITRSYDAADRIHGGGYTYDTFGRITTVPAADAGGTQVTATYYVNDLVRSLTKAGTTETWSLDPDRRLRTRTTTGGQTGTVTNHYAGGGDAPAWTADDAAGSAWTRNIPGVAGELAAVQSSQTGTTLQLANLHGDVVATASLDPTVAGPLSTFEATEFGLPRAPSTARYGWLGTQQRETDGLTGVVLMGVRLYAPSLGRFLQADPVPGGALNAYDYAGQDPVNRTDLGGTIAFVIPIVIAGAAVAVIVGAVVVATAAAIITQHNKEIVRRMLPTLVGLPKMRYIERKNHTSERSATSEEAEQRANEYREMLRSHGWEGKVRPPKPGKCSNHWHVDRYDPCANKQGTEHFPFAGAAVAGGASHGRGGTRMYAI